MSGNAQIAADDLLTAAPDGQHMLALAKDRSIPGREALAASVAGMVSTRGDKFSPTEQAIANDILHTLIRDVERSVRAALAANLAGTSAAPREVIIALANDDIDVAFPVLAESPVLQDEDLQAIIRDRATGHRIAIAMRPDLPKEVSEALLQTDDQEAVSCLLHNSEAVIRHESLARLVDEARSRKTYHSPLSTRPDLGADLALKLAGIVAQSLQARLIEGYGLDPAVVREAAGYAASDAAEALTDRENARQEDEAEGANEQKREIRQMIEILRRKEWPHFEAAMIRFAGLPAALTHAVLAERDGRKFTVLCRACNVSKPDFASLFLLSRRATPDVEVVDAIDVRDALSMYDSISRSAAMKVVSRWRAKAAKASRRTGFRR